MTVIKYRDPYKRGGFMLKIDEETPPENLKEIMEVLDSDTRRIWAEDAKERYHAPYSTDALIYDGMDYADTDTPESILLESEDEPDELGEEEKMELYLNQLTETQRRRIQMRLKGLQFKDIAEIEGTDSSSVRESVYAVWKKLHKKFPEKFPEIPPLK